MTEPVKSCRELNGSGGVNNPTAPDRGVRINCSASDDSFHLQVSHGQSVRKYEIRASTNLGQEFRKVSNKILVVFRWMTDDSTQYGVERPTSTEVILKLVNDDS